MTRHLVLILLVLAGCTSGGRDPILGAAFDELARIWPRQGDGPREGGPEPMRITRASIEAADVAAVNIQLESDASPTLMFAASDNGGYVTYVSSFGQSVTLRGTQITGTRGLGTDVLWAESSAGDPLSRPTPPGSWPAGVVRRFAFPGEGPSGRVEVYECVFEFGEVREQTILQVTYRGVEVAEICDGPDGSFESLHFADVGTGFVWRSLQWIGPDMDLIDLQVLEPYSG